MSGSPRRERVLLERSAWIISTRASYFRPHHEQGYRSCLGILRLARRYGDARLEAACQRALPVAARSYRHVESILKHGLDRMPAPGSSPHDAPVVHANLRGRDYYR